ncbi:MAG: TIGR04283 family arsenosugar biosynthesis glycosyltransferase [Anaerolineae bacterium]
MLISTIIPALNEAENIRQTITVARRSYTPGGVEVIVVDGGSTGGTPDLLPSNVALAWSPRGRAVQMNRGAAASHGETLIFCHADSQLPIGWREAVIETLDQPGVSGGAFQTLILSARGTFMHIRNRMRFPVNWWRMYGDQAQFMTRATFERTGGFPEIPLMEDAEMARALHQERQLVKIDNPRVITSSRRFLERGFLRQSLMNLWSIFRYLCLGATSKDIARVYRSSREKAA